MRFKNRQLVYLLLVIVIALGIRLLSRISVLETGWAPHLDLWGEAATSLAGYQRQKIQDQNPREQAKFWLDQVENNEAAEDDPELLTGAAWMLDSPQYGFIHRHFRMREGLDLPGLPSAWRHELDSDAIAEEEEEFEGLCRKECLFSIEKAVHLDDSNLELRRTYALLLFESKVMGHNWVPRRKDWLSVLDECSRADPDNALYDYLAALQLWTSSADVDTQQDGFVLTVRDISQFDAGSVRLASGLKKPSLSFGRKCYAATFKFLESSTAPRSDYLNAAGSRLIHLRAENLLLQIMRWKRVQSDTDKRAGRVGEAARAVRDVLAISEQVTKVDNYPGLLSSKLTLQRWSLAKLMSIEEDHPHSLSVDETANVSKQLAEVQRDSKILEEVRRRMAAKAGTAVTEVQPGKTWRVQLSLLSVFLMLTSQTFVVVCIALSVMPLLISYLFGQSDGTGQARLGIGRHAVAWLLGVSSTFVLFGMFPAEIVPVKVQANLIRGVIWIGFGTPILGLLYLIQRRFQLSLDQVAVLATATACLLILSIYARKIMEQAVAELATVHEVFLIFMALMLALIGWTALRVLWKFVDSQNLTHRQKLFAVGSILLIAVVAVPTGMALRTATYDVETWAWIAPIVETKSRDVHIDVAELKRTIVSNSSGWTWALIQWQAYRGPLMASILAVAIVIVWHRIRRVDGPDNGPQQWFRSQTRIKLREAAIEVASSCSIAALISLALYFGTAPSVAETIDNHFRIQYSRMVRTEQVWDEIAALTVEIKADKRAMARLQGEIDNRNRQRTGQ